jgi:hypothetical protein
MYLLVCTTFRVVYGIGVGLGSLHPENLFAALIVVNKTKDNINRRLLEFDRDLSIV